MAGVKHELPGEEMSFYDSASDEGGSECGVIERVRLENFRVHEVLDLDLNSNINFIVGDNGSGKSSILSAIQIGLGSKGKATGQGSNFKSFVKYGTKTAKITLHIRNVGVDAFKPNVYGPTIIVERKIGAVNSFEVKTSQNEKVKLTGSAKEEVTAIVDQFNIQVENPIMVMTQEIQKRFITATPGMLFEFFNNATQMRDIENDYRIVSEHIEEIEEAIVRTEQEELPKADERFKIAEQEYQAVEYLQQDVKKIKEAKCMYAWKVLEEKENEYEKAKDSVEAADNMLQKYDQTNTEQSREIALLIEKKEEKTRKYEEAEAIATVNLAQVEAADNEVKEIERNHSTKKKKVKQVDRELGKVKRERKLLDKQMVDELGKGDSSADLEPLMNEKNTLEESLGPAKTAYEEAAHEVAIWSRGHEDLTEAMQRAAGEERHKKVELKDLEEQCHRIRNSSKDKVTRFLHGNRARQLMDAIQKDQRFQKIPVGPLGMHIEVKDPSWGIALQTCIGSLFGSFVCDNYKDREVLTGLLKKHSINTQVVVSQFGSRYRTNGPGGQVVTVEDQIIVDNDVAFNALVDLGKIDTMALCENRDEAQHLVKTNNRVARVYLKRDGQMVSYRYGSMSFAPSTANHCALAQNQDDHLAYLEGNKQQLLHSLQEIQEVIKKDQHEKAKLVSQVKEGRRTTSGLRRKYDSMYQRYTEINDRQSEIEKEMEADEERSATLSALRDGINEQLETQQELEQLREQHIGEQREVEEERDAAIRRKEELYQSVVKKMKEEGIEVLGAEIGEIDNEIEQRKTYLKDLAKTSAERSRGLREKKADMETKEEAAVKAGLQAPKYAAGLELDEYLTRPANLASQKNSQLLWKSIQRLEERIEQRQEGVDIRAIESQYRETKKFLQVMLRKRDKQRLQLEGFRGDHKKRIKAQRKFRKTIEKLLKHKFKKYMNKRSHRGTLSINYDTKTLSFDVTVAGDGCGARGDEQGSGQPAAKKQKNGTDTKTLSGGERAFTTVAFLLALGEAMDCPVRAMDEFDCFMDAANRNVSIQQLIEFAKMQSNRQFLFLTPLSMTQSIFDLQSDPKVKIISLQSPKDQ